MISIPVKGKVTDTGELQIDPADYCTYRQTLLGLRGREVSIVIKQYRKNRTMPENRYYWGVVLEVLSDWSGHTREELHDAYRQMFLGYEENGVKYAKSTTDLNTVEMERYLEDIRNWAALQGIYVPLPNEATTD